MVVNPYRMFSLSKLVYTFAFADQILPDSGLICPLALSRVKSIFCSYFIGCIWGSILITFVG